MKNIIFFVLCFTIYFAYSQQTASTGNKGVKDGFGVLEYSGNGVYRGNFVNSLFEGYGEYYFDNGSVFKGNFKNGLYEGEGTIYYSDGGIRVANFKEGKEISVISIINANEKIGHCVSGDCQNGFGKYVYTNGEYEGSFLDGKQTGQGKFTFPNGSSLEGQFTNGILNGYGILSKANGKKYEGYFKNGQQSGIGTFYFLDGSKYIGNWTDGVINGKGEFYYSNGSYYVGEFVDGNRSGFGKVVFANGQIQEGIYENNIYKGAAQSTAVTQNTTISSALIDKKQVNLENQVVDADGNIYNTVRIRDKVWITENLRTKHYNDGQPIDQVEDFRIWCQLNTPAFCDPSSYYGYANEGLLYNHYVVEKGNVCPQGFKIPTSSVIDSLLGYYDGYNFGYFLGGFWRNYYDKTVDFDDLVSGKVVEIFPLSGFNFLDGATRESFFNDKDLDEGYSKHYEGFWLKDRKTKFDDEQYSYKVQMKWSEYSYGQSVEFTQDHIRSGNYIRCYKEYIPTISEEKVLSVKDKDDNIYKTVRIGNQIWMAEDLKTVPENTRVVFNNEELEHYSNSVFYDNFKSSGPINYYSFNLTYYIDFTMGFKDVCPQDWHLPDRGEWEIMIRNSNLKDLKSTSGWEIYKRPGYNETRRVDCSNCSYWTPSQKKYNYCSVCRNNGFKMINTGKYIPEQTTNYNGTNKSGMNIRPYPTYDGYSKFLVNNSKASYFVRDHKTKGVTLVTFGLKEVEFDKFSPDGDTRAHIRCVKD
jgi:uncharacterized protein (TIGR02145 family)